ncbi:sterol desaturase family protein [Cochlodiniinecator piscidefendens]|uniref:sterol desaturase family protein n=1 Tax=Cochlodiniinecator piscidefendens TaxID=2715756 RepID=UPI00140CE337|nr:sterol desaturase family protein [Cochlodiniinecator piscidefendens]
MENEATIRLAVFIGLFAVFAAAEAYAPRRIRTQSRARRWLTNWAIIVLDSLTLRAVALVLPLLTIGAAIDAQANGWGLLNFLDFPLWVEGIFAVLFFDFAIWLQHLITHKVPILWKLHRVHHADRDIDVSTAIRFHPIEIALSMILKIGLVYIIGPSAIAILIFEIMLNGTAMFNHANMRLPLGFDQVLRRILVTPDMHRVHHSDKRHEADSNYGFALSVWDRLFGTYIAQPEGGHDNMTIGLQWQDDRPSRLGWSLWLPFKK